MTFLEAMGRIFSEPAFESMDKCCYQIFVHKEDWDAAKDMFYALYGDGLSETI